MVGAMLGDIIGSRFEFDRSPKTKVFDYFGRGSMYTDDTVMTVAVADALLEAGPSPDEKKTKELLIRKMKLWGRRYINAGYGVRFYDWLLSDDDSPYGSYGNGSAMRVSAAGWLYDTMEQTRTVARWTAEITHNHPKGIKGAEATASVIWLARNGIGKGEIRSYVEREFHYDLSRTCDEIRPEYYHVESCQKTVPEAITAFLEGKSFEDVLRTAVSLGGDCDTLTDISCSMAEAYYDLPEELREECVARIEDDMRDVLKRFEEKRIPRKRKDSQMTETA